MKLKDLKGKVVVITAFQQHCPGSIKHGLPQAARISGAFNDDEVAVIGLNTPFEHQDKQTAAALEAFIDEQELPFPIALDKTNGKDLPKTMEAYEIRGTPTVLVFDRQGRLRRHYLGQVDQPCAPTPSVIPPAIEALRRAARAVYRTGTPASSDAGRSRPSSRPWRLLRFAGTIIRMITATTMTTAMITRMPIRMRPILTKAAVAAARATAHDHDHAHDHGHSHGHDHSHDQITARSSKSKRRAGGVGRGFSVTLPGGGSELR